jgi:uncharacterized protein YukE
MTRIRVNTEDLKSKAKDFDSAADAFNRAGDDIAAAAAAMPSYDGQLSGPARKAGYEIQNQAREMKTELAGDAESLRKTAQAFETVDNQTVNIFGDNTTLLSDAPLNGGPGGETDDLGGSTTTHETYTEWDGSTTEITIAEQIFPDGSVDSTYTQTNTKVFSEIEAKILQIKDILIDGVIDLFAAIIFTDLGFFTLLINLIGISGIKDIIEIIGDMKEHDLPTIEAGDTRVITHEGHIVINEDGSSTAVWISKIQIFDSDGKLKGEITGTYEK